MRPSMELSARMKLSWMFTAASQTHNLDTIRSQSVFLSPVEAWGLLCLFNLLFAGNFVYIYNFFHHLIPSTTFSVSLFIQKQMKPKCTSVYTRLNRDSGSRRYAEVETQACSILLASKNKRSAFLCYPKSKHFWCATIETWKVQSL